MSKVSVIGAGNVGATCANVLAFREIADEVVLLDIKEGVSEGKAMDMMQAAVTAGFASRIKGVRLPPIRIWLLSPRVFPVNRV